MAVNTWFNLGQIDELVASAAPSYLKALAAFSYGHPDDVKMVHKELLRSAAALSQTDKLLLARATLITSHLYEKSPERLKLLLQQIYNAKNVDERVFGWEVLESAYQFIYKLNSHARAYGGVLQNPSNFAVVGDSHILGMTHCFKNGRFVYIPGLRFSLLASPQPNAKIVGLKNFFANHYKSEHILVNVGEIDIRGRFVLGRELLHEGEELLILYMKKTLELIRSYSSIHQKICIAVPFCRTLEDGEDWKKYLTFIDLIKDEANAHGFSILEYPKITESDLIDHAHCSPDIYESLILRYVQGINENLAK